MSKNKSIINAHNTIVHKARKYVNKGPVLFTKHSHSNINGNKIIH